MNRSLLLFLLIIGVLALRLRITHMTANLYNVEQELERVTSQQSKFESQFLALSK